MATPILVLVSFTTVTSPVFSTIFTPLTIVKAGLNQISIYWYNCFNSFFLGNSLA